MAEYPSKITDQLDWAQSHIGNFITHAVAIGITAGDATAFQGLTDEALAAYNEAVQAKQTSKEKTLALRNAAKNLRAKASQIITTVRVKAEATKDPNVYVLAGISPRQAPSELPPPAMPQNITIGMLNDGVIELEWKGDLRTTSYFSVWRRLNNETAMTMVGVTDSKKFQDDGVPVGTLYAMYAVRAHRNSKQSDLSETVTILFGEMQQAA